MRLFLLLFLCFLISCTVYTPGQYLAPQINSLSSIPLRPHKNDVDVYFNTDKPTKPYYRVKMVEVQGDPFLSSDQMLSKLKEQAKREGIDGLLISDVGKQANNTTTLPSGDGVIAYQKLVALGVKYKERIDYMDQILKEQTVKLWPDDNPEPKIFTISFDLNGQLLPFKDGFEKQFFNYEIYPFEDENTIYFPLKNWEYNLDTLNMFFSKRMMQNNTAVIHSKFKLIGTTASIKTMSNGSDNIYKFELERIYINRNALPAERKLRKVNAKNYEWVEEILYRANGLPDKTRRYKIVNGKKVLYFEIENTYHSTNDLPATDS
ncbi:hypothetical protein WG954_08535 [Lacibacter sp. H375]|uniref:hypothetical protein n=1 Tax=Lacibacter sp. H375 TaxID=3133424 RepID=UPI0030C122A6